MGRKDTSETAGGKGSHLYKFVISGLVCVLLALLLIAGASVGLLYTYYGKTEEEKILLNSELAKAQELIDGLKEENGLLLAKSDFLPAFSEDGSEMRLKKIPFSVNMKDWKYLLVNESNSLPKDYEPALVRTSNSQYVDERIKEDLETMIKAARKEGMRLLVCSSYRSYERQDELMDESIEKYLKKGLDYKEAFFKTKEQIALTGASEHHTGLAVDIVGTRHQSLDAAQAGTKEAKWLAEHACEYGFILRYPEDKEDITGISFESWHYRYVGVDAACFMKENNLCLEEFIELAEAQKKLEENQQANAQP